MGIEGVMKIGIATKDLDKTANVLGDALGLVPGEAVAYPPLRHEIPHLEGRGLLH